MADPILESSLKTRLNTMRSDIFLLLNKKVDIFQLCLKTAASLFISSSVTFLIVFVVKINPCKDHIFRQDKSSTFSSTLFLSYFLVRSLSSLLAFILSFFFTFLLSSSLPFLLSCSVFLNLSHSLTLWLCDSLTLCSLPLSSTLSLCDSLTLSVCDSVTL
jgi:hypothetical protein